jgi:DNA-binding beta-propeller fold protein YncE
MALTTYVKGRAYDWSHAIGRASANGTGFNYPQTMCLGNDGDVYVANRGNENNFGMRVNHVRVGGPGEEGLLAEFATYGAADGKTIWPFGVAVDKQGHVYVTDEWTSTVSVFDGKGKFIRKWGTPGSGPGELRGPAGIVCEPNGNVIVVDNRPWGIALDHDRNIYVADWKNHRVQKLSPSGKFIMSIGRYGKLPVEAGSFAVTYLGPFISSVPPSERIKPGILNHPTGVAVDPDGDIYVTDWGNHRLSIFDKSGQPLTNLVGDAQVMSKWGQQSIDANPDMMKAYRRVQNQEQLWRFCFPTAVVYNPKSDQIIVADSQRNRLQVYKKVRDYVDFQANL